MFKKYFLLLLFTLIFLSCSKNQKESTKVQQKNIITIDTTISKIVSGEEFTTITTKLDSIIRLKKTNVSKDGEKIGKMIEYFDTSGIKVKQISENYLLENSYAKTYIWYESSTSKKIMSIDSLFNKKDSMITSVNTVYGDKDFDTDFVSILKTYTLIGEVFRTAITPPKSNYTYIETINGFYSFRNDIPSKYVETENATKTEFGLAYKTVLVAEKNAKLRIKEPVLK